MHSNRIILVLSVCLIAVFTSCEESSISNESIDQQGPASVDYVEVQNAKGDKKGTENTGGFEEGVYSEHLAELNEELAAKGLDNIQIVMAETITYSEDGGVEAGQTLFADDRTKTLPSQWQANDPIRSAVYGAPVGNDLTHTVYSPFAVANGSINSEPDIDASFETWNNLKKNSGLDIVKVPTPAGVFPSAILTLGGIDDPFVADISTIGFLPGAIFDAVLGAGASSSVLGVTFTFTWTAAPDVVALKEVWYNDDFTWSNDGSAGIDIETVALHENGHALGFGHFGKISVTNANGKLHVSPRAVMNAAYLGPVREPLGTDKASFNNVYGSWPKD
ncbi:MAG: hypothetical protein R3220_03770 [Balneolaceae bacterium]|nr:hypothetical protein [Balneolaceae bacterium]